MTPKNPDEADEEQEEANALVKLFKGLDLKSIGLGVLLAGGGGISAMSALTPKNLEPRVMALETQCKIAEAKADTDRQRLERIETKLDRLLYRSPDYGKLPR